jgi:tRNA A-37 threonylcarbamoyl transferase component Bud32
LTMTPVQTESLGGGKYTILRRLAAGGMGEVLLMQTRGTDALRPGIFVMKRVLPARPGEEPTDAAVRMLREEARLGMRLRHQNLVHTFGLEELDGQTLLAMEFLAGRSMAQMLGQAKKSREPMPVDVVLQIVRYAACGLHFAHTLKGHDGTPLGLVHRDVSPANIFVTFNGEVKVIDFGVAKSADSEIHTAQNVLKGKLGYMSPEQATTSVERLTAQADVFSLGVFFWESLIAERLFYSPNAAATLMQISTKEVPLPSSLRPDVSAAVDGLCMAMLERGLARRPKSCAEVVRAIDGVLATMPKTSLKFYISRVFAGELDTMRAEAEQAARLIDDVGAPSGLVEGTAALAASDEEEAATAVLSPQVRARMLEEIRNIRRSSADSQVGNTEEQEAATIRVTGDQLKELRANLPKRPEPVAFSHMEDRRAVTVPIPAAMADVQAPTAPDGQLTKPLMTKPLMTQGAFELDPGLTIPAPTRASTPLPPLSPSGPFAPPTQSSTMPAPTAAKSAPSTFAVAATFFGLATLVMGPLLYAVAPAVPPRALVSAMVDGKVVVGTSVADFPSGAALLNESTPQFAGGTTTDAATLQERVASSGLSVRRTLPNHPRGWALLAAPLVLVAVGLMCCSMGLPGLRSSSKNRSVLRGLAALISVVIIGALVIYGGLGWPGAKALKTPTTMVW